MAQRVHQLRGLLPTPASFHPARLMEKFERAVEFDWDDLRDLVRRDAKIDRARICADCVRGFRFLSDPTPEERKLPVTLISGNRRCGNDYAQIGPERD
jgi:hypothetical protein